MTPEHLTDLDDFMIGHHDFLKLQCHLILDRNTRRYKQLTHEPKPWTINVNAFLDHPVNVSFRVNLDQFLQYQLPTPESSSMVKAVSRKCIP